MRNLFVALGLAVSVAGVTLAAVQAPQLPPKCKASYVLTSKIADKASAVPEEFKADLAAGTVRLDVAAFLTGKPLPESKDLQIDWKATGGLWDARSASGVLELIHKTSPNGILLWSGSTRETCHQDVGNPLPARASK